MLRGCVWGIWLRRRINQKKQAADARGRVAEAAGSLGGAAPSGARHLACASA